jgi:hypothetical protein
MFLTMQSPLVYRCYVSVHGSASEKCYRLRNNCTITTIHDLGALKPCITVPRVLTAHDRARPRDAWSML